MWQWLSKHAFKIGALMFNMAVDTDVLSAGFACLLSAAHLYVERPLRRHACVRSRPKPAGHGDVFSDRFQPEPVIDSIGSVMVNYWQISIDHCTHGVLSHAHDCRFTLWPP